MNCLESLEKAIFDFADANGAAWLAEITGGIFPGRAPDCAAGQSPRVPYCVWNLYGATKQNTATHLRDRERIQFAFYGDNRKKINDITLGCVSLFGSTFEDSRDLDPTSYPDLRMRSDDPAYIPAIYDNTDPTRFALWVGIALFYVDITITTI